MVRRLDLQRASFDPELLDPRRSEHTREVGRAHVEDSLSGQASVDMTGEASHHRAPTRLRDEPEAGQAGHAGGGGNVVRILPRAAAGESANEHYDESCAKHPLHM